MNSINLVPAYGRDYKSKKEVLADFDSGKDFMIQDISCRYDGKYCSKRDLKDYNHVTIRYKKLMNVAVIKQ